MAFAHDAGKVSRSYPNAGITAARPSSKRKDEAHLIHVMAAAAFSV
jgi:hypothetical protein